LTASRALISFMTLATNPSFRSDHLKLCYLWYDEVLFETIGQYEEARFFGKLVGNEHNARKTIKALTDIIMPLGSRVSTDVKGDILDSMRRGYPRWGDNHENYTYPEPKNAEQYAHNRLLQSIAAEFGVSRFEDGYYIEQAEGRTRVAVDAVLLWGRVNAEVQCMLQAGPDEKLAMIAAHEFSSVTNQTPSPFSLFEIAIPSLSNVSWHEIVTLRHKGGLDSLREKIANAVSQAATDLKAAKKLFDNFESNAIDNIVETARPKVGKVAIETVLANIPIPIVNPFGIAFALRDMAEVAKRSQDLSWLYLLRDIKKTAKARRKFKQRPNLTK
jgi:hypothetical protein